MYRRPKTVSDSSDKTNLISMPEAAEIYGFNADYLARLVRQRKIKGRKIGGVWVATQFDIEDFIRTRKRRGVYRADIQLD